MKVLIFDIWADYAQFRKYYTNMSPLTFQFPPRTVVSGIIGALIGIDREVNAESFTEDNSKIAVQIVQESSKVKIPVNYLKTSGGTTEFSRYKEHKPTLVEYLRQPRYRIYFSHLTDSIYDKVKENLQRHATHYTLCLGISNCLANFEFIREEEFVERKGEEYKTVVSSIPRENIVEVDFGNRSKIYRTLLPCIMKNDREVSTYKEYLFESTGKPIIVKVKECWDAQRGNESICWL